MLTVVRIVEIDDEGPVVVFDDIKDGGNVVGLQGDAEVGGPERRKLRKRDAHEGHVERVGEGHQGLVRGTHVWRHHGDDASAHLVAHCEKRRRQRKEVMPSPRELRMLACVT